MKKKIMFAALIMVAACAGFAVANAVAPFVWHGTITTPSLPVPHPTPTPTTAPTPTPSPTPTPTDTFTVIAALNGTIQANPNAIVLPSTVYIGDIYTITYQLTSTANQAISVSEQISLGGLVGTWDKTSVDLPTSGNSATMTLTITIGTTTGTASVAFTATP